MKWKPIKCFEGLYEVSDTGSVRRMSYTDFGNASKHPLPHVLTPKLDRYGYPKITLSKDRKLKYITIHRLVAETFIENPFNLPQVNHIDGNKTNNSVSNLEWISVLDNARHAHETGLHKGCRTKVEMFNGLDTLTFDSIVSACEYLKIDRHYFCKHALGDGDHFKKGEWDIVLSGGKRRLRGDVNG